MDISSPKRRKSIAVVSSLTESSPATKSRRRAHSIAPGDRLAHLAKVRRSLAPRKSILKSGNALQSFPYDSPNGSQSMDLTQIQLPSRKSLGGGRVSFAKKISVRVIGPSRRREHSSSSVPESDSPTGPEREPYEEEEEQPPPVAAQNNENDYPGATGRNRRRSSTRMSMGMLADDSSPLGANLLDDIIDDDEPGQVDEDDMDLSESPVVQRQLFKRRSLMPGSSGERNPLSTLEVAGEEAGRNGVPESEADMSMAYSSDPPVEYEHPINKPLRPSLAPHEDPIYQQLLAVAGGSQPSVDPDDSVNSLEGAYNAQSADDSLISDDSSFNAEGNQDQTVNMSAILGRPSLGGRSSLQDESMELSSVIDAHGENDTWDRRGTVGNVRLSMAAVFEDDETGLVPIGPRRSSVAGQSLLDQNLDETDNFTTGSAMELTVAPTAQLLATVGGDIDIPPPAPAPAIEAAQSYIPPVFSLPQQTPLLSTSSSAPLATTPREKSFTRPNPFSRPSMTAPRTTSPTKPKPSAAFALPTAKPSPKKFSGEAASYPKKRPRPTDGSDTVRPSPLKKQALGPSTSQLTRRPSLSTNATAAASRRLSTKFSMRRKSIAAENGTPQPPLADTTPTDQPMPFQSTNPQPTFSVFREPQPYTDPTPSVGGNSSAPSVHTVPSPLPRRNSMIPTRQPSVVPQAPIISIPKNVPARVPSVVDTSANSQAAESNDEGAPLGDSTQKWVQDVQESETADVEMPSLSIQQFMDLTDIRFMDELSAPRRSSVRPSDLTIRRRRSMGPSVSDNASDKPEIPLQEYIIAMAIDVPRLSLYNRVTEDLTNWIEISKSELAQAENDAAQVTPELFREFIQADDEGRDEIKQQLLLTRTHKRYLAKSEWYKWKLQWVEHLHDELKTTYEALQKDDQLISEIDAELDRLLPNLEQEYETVTEELQREQAEVAEIDNCDQEYLNELKATIAEQSVEVEALHAEVSEDASKLEWLSNRLKEAEAEKQRHTSYIETCRRTLNVCENSTQEEITRMEAHLSTLLDLHMMHNLHWSDNIFQFEYASEFLVKIRLKEAVPFAGGTTVVSLSGTSNRRKDAYPQLTRYFLDLLQECTNSRNMTLSDVVHQIISTWSRCERIRAQLNFIPIKFPLAITTSSSGIAAKVLIYFPKAESKAYVTFHISSQCISSWPKSLRDLRWDIQVAYGPVTSTTLDQAIRSRLEQATPKDCHGCIFDACVEAFDVYG